MHRFAQRLALPFDKLQLRDIARYLFAITAAAAGAVAQEPSVADQDFKVHAKKLRDAALRNIEPHVTVPTFKGVVPENYPWKSNIVTTVFSIGERGGSNGSSAWDADWQRHYGGVDETNPKARSGFCPSFSPKLNPFYVALPYNDIIRGTTKPEARAVIPWFRTTFEREGGSVCKDRWVAVRKGNRTCYAQWSDCGPFHSDHYQYVFGNERPKPNRNQGAGLCVSPAVRDYLGVANTDVTDWKFVEFRDVPGGPWAQFGENNPFLPSRP